MRFWLATSDREESQTHRFALGYSLSAGRILAAAFMALIIGALAAHPAATMRLRRDPQS